MRTIGFIIPLVLLATIARADFIDDDLMANGYCGSMNTGVLRNGWGIDLKTPFGKPAIKWNQADLDHLGEALDKCEKLAHYGSALDFRGLKTFVPQLVKKAKDEEAYQIERAQAAERARASKAVADLEAAQETRKAAEADSKAAEIERSASQKQAEEENARNQAAISSAHARRDAALNRQKAAALADEARKAEAEADLAEGGADHPSPYRSVSVTDLQINARSMIGQKVAVRGYVFLVANPIARITTHTDDVNGLDLDIQDGDAKTRRYILQRCGRLSSECRMEVHATVVKADETPKLKLD